MSHDLKLLRQSPTADQIGREDHTMRHPEQITRENCKRFIAEVRKLLDAGGIRVWPVRLRQWETPSPFYLVCIDVKGVLQHIWLDSWPNSAYSVQEPLIRVRFNCHSNWSRLDRRSTEQFTPARPNQESVEWIQGKDLEVTTLEADLLDLVPYVTGIVLGTVRDQAPNYLWHPRAAASENRHGRYLEFAALLANLQAGA